MAKLTESFMSLPMATRNRLPEASIAIPKGRLQVSQLGSRRCNVYMSSAPGNVEEVELVKIFGRLAEKMIFGDGSAGACCHSGCDDCEWRYSFDIMQAARPKWIPCYRLVGSENRFEDGREHVAKWSSLFNGENTITREALHARLKEMKFEMPLGPSGYLTASQAELKDVRENSPYPHEAVDLFWAKISANKEKVTPKQMSIRLRKMATPGEEGVMWSDFAASILHEQDEEVEEDLDAIVV
eukprot:760593-Hanusia_phi.AAC.17